MFDQRQYLQTDRSEGSYGDVGITSARESCRAERGRLSASSVRVRLQSGGARVRPEGVIRESSIIIFFRTAPLRLRSRFHSTLLCFC